jgi:aldehyde dehydrogenase (NAD+)
LDNVVPRHRIIIHESIYDKVKEAIVSYKQLRIGNPLMKTTMGPVIDKHAVEMYSKALEK